MSAVLSGALPHLRDMLEADVPAVLAIERVAYEFPWTEGILRDCFKFGYTCKVYESGEGIIGYGIISIGAGECHFLNICIAPPHQQHGHGARLHAGDARAGVRLGPAEGREPRLLGGHAAVLLAHDRLLIRGPHVTSRRA